ncbi:MAG TPA: phospholipase D-like domain-containing protein [Candidatus Acidoferrum sp.]|nr:phospholipase D-like domain-containing protein [Candidatus Acidoferrum sp.]
MDWLDKIARFWPHLAAGFDFLACLLASVHALLHKRDTRAATLWLGFIWLVPVIGPLLYLALGVNRIRRRALVLGVHKTRLRGMPRNLGEPEHEGAEHLKLLASVVSRVVTRPLTPGNHVRPLVNGDEAFPAMLAAIESAQKSLSLVTYIFDNDTSGRQFAEALGQAVQRGVAVRVLIDAAGTRYSWPSILHRLRADHVPCAKFLPASLLTPWRVATINLRNHRKILVVDGQTAFTGGMNIRRGNVLADHPASPVQDLHFRVEGPVVTQLQDAFVNDWAFSTGEVLDGEAWFPEARFHPRGVVARVITDGPDADFEKLRWTLLAALAEAQTSVQIVTPYFLPDPALVSALNLAALRGARVDIILPGKNNLPFVHWASRAMWWQVLEHGCHIWLTPPPFDHSKLMVVDGHWVLLGSANWDARSLRLNFELNVEGYGRELANELAAVIAKKLLGAHEVTKAEVDGRTIPGKLRDAAARLFAPFL